MVKNYYSILEFFKGCIKNGTDARKDFYWERKYFMNNHLPLLHSFPTGHWMSTSDDSRFKRKGKKTRLRVSGADVEKVMRRFSSLRVHTLDSWCLPRWKENSCFRRPLETSHFLFKSEPSRELLLKD